MKSSGSNCWSVVDPKHWTSLAHLHHRTLTGGPHAFSHLNLHLLQVFVGRVFVAMVLHLVQVTLFGGKHRVDLEEQRPRITAGPLREWHRVQMTWAVCCAIPWGPNPAQRPISIGWTKQGLVVRTQEDEREKRRVQGAMLLKAGVLKA